MASKTYLLLLAIISYVVIGIAQHEDIPYEDVEDICDTCECLTAAKPANKHVFHSLNCVEKKFHHILARWPEQFGKNNEDTNIVATFSGNSIELLQQLPATNASLTFSCRHCGIKQLQEPTFVDVPNIKQVDLSYNEITTSALTANLFRGPYQSTDYQSIGLVDLDLSHNLLHALGKNIFQHTPNLTTLSLSYNNLTVLNSPTLLALGSATRLESLDLSHTGIESISATLFRSLTNLKILNLAGNYFKVMPEMNMLGESLEVLNLAGNLFEQFAESDFNGLQMVTHLNISNMNTLKEMQRNTFAPLKDLEYLHCSHNPNLDVFDLDGLQRSKNLSYLDISYCGISSLNMVMNLTRTAGNAENGDNTTTYIRPWARLLFFETVGNPWFCDCELLQTLEFIGPHHKYKDTETRCDTPYIFAGARISNLTAEQICSKNIPKKFRVIDEDPSRFLRKRYIILTVITASVVIIIGLIIGFLVVCIRRRLIGESFGVEPIRYTSVRSSNLSAFSQNFANNGATNGTGNQSFSRGYAA